MGKKQAPEMPHLTRTEAIILGILLSGSMREMYGLEIVEASEGKITRGSVYVLANRMEDKGLITSRREKSAEVPGGLPRVLYTPTGTGQRVFRAWRAARRSWDLGFAQREA